MYPDRKIEKYGTACPMLARIGLFQKLNELEYGIANQPATVEPLSAKVLAMMRVDCPVLGKWDVGAKVNELAVKVTTPAGPDVVKLTLKAVSKLHHGCPSLKDALVGEKVNRLIDLANAL